MGVVWLVVVAPLCALVVLALVGYVSSWRAARRYPFPPPPGVMVVGSRRHSRYLRGLQAAAMADHDFVAAVLALTDADREELGWDEPLHVRFVRENAGGDVDRLPVMK